MCTPATQLSICWSFVIFFQQLKCVLVLPATKLSGVFANVNKGLERGVIHSLTLSLFFGVTAASTCPLSAELCWVDWSWLGLPCDAAESPVPLKKTRSLCLCSGEPPDIGLGPLHWLPRHLCLCRRPWTAPRSRTSGRVIEPPSAPFPCVPAQHHRRKGGQLQGGLGHREA